MRQKIKFLIAGVGLCFAFASASLAASPGVAVAKHSTEITAAIAPELSVHLGMEVTLQIGQVNIVSARKLVNDIKAWESADVSKITIAMHDTSGGDVLASFKIIDAMKACKVPLECIVVKPPSTAALIYNSGGIDLTKTIFVDPADLTIRRRQRSPGSRS